MARTGLDILTERAVAAGVQLGEKIPEETFLQLGLPIVVECTGCAMTMALPNAIVDDDLRTWCGECAEAEGLVGEEGSE